ncbi:MAG: sodium-dependent transporter [Myxococcales bacterium]|nr:sodium-dependent transporter [Myxococcales bacterium]
MSEARGQWGSRISFVLAAAGSAVGLGNLWKFPYITGMNGGGAFVLIYLVCILLVGLPIMIGEVLLGRMSRSSVVGTFSKLSDGPTPWSGIGWIGVAAGVVILSYYSVVAGWSLHYVWLAISGGLAEQTPEALGQLFGETYADPAINLRYHTLFMIFTALIVVGGIQKGVERAARVMMPLLLVMLAAMLAYATTLDGFGRAFDFVFGFHTDALTGAGVLEALGHSFFTLSLGMGAMLTYGSYLSRHDDVVAASLATTFLDTLVALMACLVLFPITFSAGMEPAGGPGLVFVNMPIAFSGLPGGQVWAVLFFLLLFFAALTSAISLLEVAAAYFIDERGWSRKKAVAVTATTIFALGIPSALSGGDSPIFGAEIHWIGERNWFDSFDYLASNWMLPLGGLGIAAFAAWRLGDRARHVAFAEGSRLGAIPAIYLAWLQLLRYLVPVAIVLVMLNAIGVLKKLGLGE